MTHPFDDDEGSSKEASSSSSSPTSEGELSGNEVQFLESLANLKLVGNKEERKMLKQAFERVKMGGMSEVLFLHGESGVGKSKTAQDVFHKLTTTTSGHNRGKKKKKKKKSAKDGNNNKQGGGGLFVSSKFDQLQSNSDPYAAIVAAFSDICDKIEQSQDDDEDGNKRQVQQNLQRNLSDDEALILVKLIPNLVNLMSKHVQDSAAATSIDKTTNSSSSVQAFIKFKLLCRKFLCAVATQTQPIILFLDDLQWADDGSMEIFKALCSDMESKYVLIVGAYRDEEDYEPPTNMETILPSTDVKIEPLRVDDVNRIVSSLIGMPSSKETLPLGQVVHAKTRGNAQFVKLFLESLYTKRLLTYSVEKGSWEYDVGKVTASTNDAASNVLIAAKIDRLGTDVKDILKFASCLGFTFDLEHLRVVVVAEHEHLTGKKRLPGTKTRPASEKEGAVEYRETLLKLIDKAMKHGILLPGRRAGTFSFCHDNVFEAVYTSLPTGLERQQLHVRIGRLLLDVFQDNEYVTFLAVDHLNQGARSIEFRTDKLELARLNLAVAKLSIEKYSAFDRANDFAVAGLSLFPSDDLWAIDYPLALDLHTTGAQSSIVGASPEGFVDKIVLHGKSLQDKIPAYAILMNFYCWDCKPHEAIEVGFEMMELLGEKLPRNAGKAHVAWEFVLARQAIGNKSDSDLLAIPEATSWKDIAVLVTLREVGTTAYFSKPDLMVVTVLRSLRYSIRNGLYSERSPAALASYAFVLFHLGKQNEAFRFLKLSSALSEREKPRYSKAITVSIAYGLGFHHRQPLENMYEPLVEGYVCGEKYGDTGQALLCSNMSCYVKLVTGAPLGEVEKLLDRYIGLMKAYNRHCVFVLTCPLHQRVLNLMGRSDKATVLTGTAMTQDELLSELEERGNVVATAMLLDHVFQLCCMFEEWKHAHMYYKQMRKYAEAVKMLDTHLAMRQHKFFCALFCIVWYRRTGKKPYKTVANRILRLMKDQQATGCPNYDCYVPILVAELSTINSSNHEEATKDALHAAYWRAADACKYVHLKGLAHERAASVIEELFGDHTLAKEHLLAAKRNYAEWEADAKVRDVEGKLKYL